MTDRFSTTTRYYDDDKIKNRIQRELSQLPKECSDYGMSVCSNLIHSKMHELLHEGIISSFEVDFKHDTIHDKYMIYVKVRPVLSVDHITMNISFNEEDLNIVQEKYNIIDSYIKMGEL